MSAQRSLIQRLTVSSKNVLHYALGLALSEGREQINARDVLFGASQVHRQGQGEPSQIIELLDYFGISEPAFFAALRLSATPRISEAVPEAGDDHLGSDASYVLEASLNYAEKFNRVDTPPLVRLKDLIAALLIEKTAAQEIMHGLLSAPEVSYDAVVNLYLDYLGRGADADLPQMLAERFPRPKPVDASAVTPPPVDRSTILRAVSGFGADVRAGADLVGIGAEIDAFAYLISSVALKPPLAIGLFGDWGSGKTYFMQSLKERIHFITKEARDKKTPQGQISIYKYVAQIEFNAWHYVEGELWASLVENIFHNLETGEKEVLPVLEARHKHLLEQLRENRQSQLDLKQRKQALEDQTRQLQGQMVALKEKWENQSADLEQKKAEEIYARLAASLRKAGLGAPLDSTKAMLDAVNDFRDVVARGNTLAFILRRGGLTALLVLVVLSGPLISLALAQLKQIPSFTNILMSLSAFASFLALFLRWATAQMKPALRDAEKAIDGLETEQQRIESQSAGEFAEQQRQIDAVAEQYQEVSRKHDQLEREAEDLEKALDQVVPDQVLRDFIQERVGSDDYRKWLGIPALIRRDFDQLSQLIDLLNADIKARDGQKDFTPDEHTINRIVLYIDDLDRCPPDKVVKVLQAVHLLLYFPLFVVVVAVDARWLSQSLQEYYGGLLTTSANAQSGETEEGALPATPQDYLEKIFQIPFWIHSLSESARVSLVNGLVRESMKRFNDVAVQVNEAAAGETVPAVDGGSKPTLPTMTQTVIPNVQPDTPAYSKESPASQTPGGLDIELPEAAFMADLKSLLGVTPRSVKRFVNIYWLMKSIALAQDPTAPFISGERYADYRQVLFLLAVLTGLPTIAHDFFALLCAARRNSAGDGGCPETLRQVINALQRQLDQRSRAGSETYAAQRDLDRLKDWACDYASGQWLEIPTSLLGAWAPQVGRFSYRMEHI